MTRLICITVYFCFQKMSPGLFCNRLVRKKTIITSTIQDTKLRRCLGLVDLVGLGLGSSLGLGVYVITSYAIKNDAGPSFVISVILAGVAALFSGKGIIWPFFSGKVILWPFFSSKVILWPFFSGKVILWLFFSDKVILWQTRMLDAFF